MPVETAYHSIAEEIDRSHRTNRPPLYHCFVFGYKNPEDLKNKLILDVGSGDSQLAPFLQKTTQCSVISLDPDYQRTKPGFPTEAVIGISQQLPFQDGTFDESLASYSLYWINTGLENALAEMIRITKRGGLVKIHPASSYLPQSFQFPPQVHLNRETKTLIITKDETSLLRWLEIIQELIPQINFEARIPDIDPFWEHSNTHKLKYGHNFPRETWTLYRSVKLQEIPRAI